MENIDDLLTPEEKKFKSWLEITLRHSDDKQPLLLTLNKAYSRAERELIIRQKRGTYLISLENEFLLITRAYLNCIEDEQAKIRLKQDAYKTIKKTHISHYIRLSEQFPDILPAKKEIISSPAEAEPASKN